MGYSLGIDIGTTFCAAALVRGDRAEIIALGNHAATIPSMVFLREDDTVLVGDAAERRGLQEPARLAREFKRRLGDSAPILLDRTPFSSERLMAVLLRQIIADVTQRQGGGPDSVTITHPANWGQFKIDLLRQATELAGIPEARFITEPVAAAVQYASTERVDVGDVIAVYDLGGGTFDAAVLRKTATGFETLGRPNGIERLGGIDFDEAVFAHVRRSVGGAVDQLDPTDPGTRTALARLRQECVAAKETLSSDSDATVPVLLPNVQTQVRVTRAEFEDMIRPLVRETVDTMRRAVEGAGVALTDVKAILLAGGSSRIPLISDLVRSELQRPIVTDSHPKHAVAMGAARSAVVASAAASLPSPTVAAPAPTPTVAAAPPPPAAPAPTVLAQPGAAQPAPTQLAPTQQTPTVGATGGRPGGPPPPAAPRERSRWPLFAGVGAVLAAVIVGLVVFGNRDPKDSQPDTTTGSNVSTVTEPPTSNGGTTEPGTITTEPTTTEPPPTATATNPPTPGGEVCDEVDTLTCVGIVDATWTETGVLLVNYTARGFTPNNNGIAGQYHVHFFFSSVPPTQAGLPGSGPWYVWDLGAGGGAYLFDGADLNNITDNGYQPGDDICITLATHDHRLATDDGSGTPWYYCLPDTPTAPQ